MYFLYEIKIIIIISPEKYNSKLNENSTEQNSSSKLKKSEKIKKDKSKTISVVDFKNKKQRKLKRKRH